MNRDNIKIGTKLVCIERFNISLYNDDVFCEKGYLCEIVYIGIGRLTIHRYRKDGKVGGYLIIDEDLQYFRRDLTRVKRIAKEHIG